MLSEIYVEALLVDEELNGIGGVSLLRARDGQPAVSIAAK